MRLLVLQPSPFCNISCSYCYLSDRDNRKVMTLDVVRAVARNIIARLDIGSTLDVVWHAGEPTVVPLSWYREAYRCLSEASTVALNFSLQTNGVGFTDEWAVFCVSTRTRVGISIDGPETWHDLRRRTRNGKPTWQLAVAALKRAVKAGLPVSVISVLHPSFLDKADEYLEFCMSHEITEVGFNIDEQEGCNSSSSFGEAFDKRLMSEFLLKLLSKAFARRYPLRIREIERVASNLFGGVDNELTTAGEVLVVGAGGELSTFAPELFGSHSIEYANFVFGNVIDLVVHDLDLSPLIQKLQREIWVGVERCRSECEYFAVCGGGSPANKFFENGGFDSKETTFCKASFQAPCDALSFFLRGEALRHDERAGVLGLLS